MMEVDRADIKAAAYNPRFISDESRRKLKRAIEKVGLVAPITWNKRTGRIVGGHQRIKALDAIHGGKKYRLRVAAVDMSDEEEKAANVLLNNQEAAGEWDVERLLEMLKDETLDTEAMGFSSADMFRYLGDEAKDEVLEEVADKVDRLREAERTGLQNIESKHETNWYLVVFADTAERTEFLQLLGLVQDRYQHGRDLLRALREKLGREVGEEPTPPTDD